jgi:membrane dipeptidase
MPESEQPLWKKIQYAGLPIVDMHAHPALKATLFKRTLTRRYAASRTFNPFSVRTDFQKLEAGGVDVLLSVIYAPEKEIVEDFSYLRILSYLMPITYRKLFSNSYFSVTNEMINIMEAQVQQSPKVELARSVQELNAILGRGDQKPIAIVHCIEGAHSLEGKLENLEKLHQRGVAYMILAHFYPNAAVEPVFPFPEFAQKLGHFKDRHDITRGLTDFGQQVVEKMVEIGMIPDITHCTPRARQQIYEIVGNRMPIIASHIGAYEINPSPYNLKDWEIKRIAETGGMVAVIFMNYWLMPHETKQGLNFIARTIEHFVNVAGIEHVGIGTDFDGFTDPPDDVKDASRLPVVTQRLLAEGYKQAEIEKILGTNALRVLRQGWHR